MASTDRVDNFEYDVNKILHKGNRAPGRVEYKEEVNYAPPINDDVQSQQLSVRERWAEQQARGKQQQELGVQVPINKHRCDDHLEDIVLVLFFYQIVKIFSSILSHLYFTVSECFYNK